MIPPPSPEHQAYRREPEQVQVPAAGRRPAEQAVGEDAEQVEGQDELMGSPRAEPTGW